MHLAKVSMSWAEVKGNSEDALGKGKKGER